MRHFLAGAILVASVFVGTDARAADDDPWFGDDKLLHYGVSAGIAGAGYVTGALLFGTRAHGLILGAGVTAIIGVSKEVRDAIGPGNPSWKDLAWDGLGMVTGLGIAWGLDLLIRGVSAEHPLFAVDRGGIAF